MLVKKFGEISKDMIEKCGGKASHLGELTRLGLNVPKGFCVVGESYYHHLKRNRLDDRIATIAESINFEDFQDLEEKTGRIRSLVESAQVPPEVEKEIGENYENLLEDELAPFVAIRSSVAVKDSEISSFPGMLDTYHYVRGTKNVIECVRRCWASVWSASAAFARYNKGLDHWKAIIAPIVQLMVNSESAGVAFTANPVSGQKGEIVIESNWGLGEAVVCGKCICDFYTVDKKKLTVKEKRIARKEQKFIQAEGGGAKWVEVEKEKIDQPTLDDAQIEQICRIACMIEDHYGYPQDIEWAFEKGTLYTLQARRARLSGE